MAYQFEYVTSAVSLLMQGNQGDGIVVHLVNDSPNNEEAEVTIYRNGVVATQDAQAGIPPSSLWGLGYTIPSSGEYWVRVRVGSEFSIPTVCFERLQGGIWGPVARYLPGDFAVFDLSGRRRVLR